MKEFIRTIKTGKRPIIILPDTSMRGTGLLLHGALSTAFPEYFRKGNRDYIFFVAPSYSDEGHSIRQISPNLEKILRSNINSRVLVMDYFPHGPDSRTWKTISNKIKSYNSNVELSQISVDEENYQFGRIGTDFNGKSYGGKTGVMKPDMAPKDYPPLIVARRENYIRKNKPEEYTAQLELKKRLYKLGLAIGNRFKQR